MKNIFVPARAMSFTFIPKNGRHIMYLPPLVIINSLHMLRHNNNNNNTTVPTRFDDFDKHLWQSRFEYRDSS